MEIFFPVIIDNQPDCHDYFSMVSSRITRTYLSWCAEMPGKINSDNMKKIILEICEANFLSLKDLAALLERDPKALQDQYLTPFLVESLLELKYPDIKNHPDQAYRSKK
jgi:hypothetical protein